MVVSAFSPQSADAPVGGQVKVEGTTSRHKGGAITLVRHGEPALSRRVKLTARGYGEWWARYEVGGLLEGQQPPQVLKDYIARATHLLSSTRQRALETARMACGERAFESLDLFIEAPLPPPDFPDSLKFSPKHWGAISRFWWWAFNNHKGQETRREAEARARKAADVLLERAKGGDEVVLMAHGYFNYMISRELKRSGYVKTHEQGFKYWGCRRYEAR